MMIGLTGPNCSGKGEIANILKEKRYKYYSCSDVIREEAEKRKLEKTRENLIAIGNELREKLGPNVLAKKLLEKIKEDRKKGQKDFIVDSIRNPNEVEELKTDNEFSLLGINAPIELRYERAKARGRVENVNNFDDFKQMDEKENSSNPNAQQLNVVYKMADKYVFNDSTLEDLKKRLDFALKYEKKERPSWAEYFMKITSVVAERSTCLRHNVGAIIVKNKRLLTTGYNGAVRGNEDCLKLGCKKDELGLESGFGSEECRAVHAEQNAIIQGALHGINIEGATLYCTTIPCRMCAKEIVNAGIKEVITYSDYAGAKGSIEFLQNAGVNFRKIPRPNNSINFKD
ncbi:MAG: hypothetical protein COT14_00800 [Candidatus Diapherotrites archaeon CG08_land_8_20_14_0_20_30_16]|nr:MAG: hypothetical protein COT14_00800 [Candidatus Diapherotrites archaeon CG08_land_8_20_14_0_20_30_16]